LGSTTEGKRSAVDEQHRHAADQQQQHEEHTHPGRSVEDRAEVDRHAGHDEEHRDEEAVADGVQLGLERMRASRRPVPKHDAGQEGAEDDVEPELAGQHEQRDE